MTFHWASDDDFLFNTGWLPTGAGSQLQVTSENTGQKEDIHRVKKGCSCDGGGWLKTREKLKKEGKF